MIVEWIRFSVCALFVVGGVFFIFCGVLGVFRFDFVLNRIHSSALCDTMGLSLILAGLMVARGFGWESGKLLIVIFFLWLTSPISGHLIGKLEFVTNENLADHCSVIPDSKPGGKEE